MNKILLAAALAMASAAANAQVSASITIGDPNFYGVINIGDVPEPPRLIYREPRIVEHVHVVETPVYMRVPPGHAKHWDKHCHEYHACNRKVYFVDDDWYETRYVPVYREKHGHGHGDDHDDGDHGNHGDHGEGHGHGGGHGKGHKGGKH